MDALAARFRPRIVTLAPELPGALGAIRRLARSGAAVACGHTDAGLEEGRAAIEAGARLLTHALNPMRGIEPRAPSALVAFLGDRRAHVSLIGDGVLAGGAAPLWQGVRTLVDAGIPLGAALAAACIAPRRLLGLAPGLGAGDPADLVVLDAGLMPRLTLVGGAVALADLALPFDVPEPGRPFRA